MRCNFYALSGLSEAFKVSLKIFYTKNTMSTRPLDDHQVIVINVAFYDGTLLSLLYMLINCRESTKLTIVQSQKRFR